MYLLKERYIISVVFELFLNEIKNQFSTSLCVLRTDVLDYVKNDVSLFCFKNGIIHQTYCSHTSQQKRIAERKHRNILNVAKTMMIHMNVPKYLWSEAVLSAWHLINRMPSSVLNGKVSFSFLYPTKNPISITPCVFGCMCFVQNLSLGLDKLSSRSIKCVFQGILELRKNTGATVLTSILCLQMSRSLSLFHTSLHRVQLLHQSLPFFHHLCRLHLLLIMFLFANVTGKHYSATCIKASEKRFQTRLRSSVKSSYL